MDVEGTDPIDLEIFMVEARKERQRQIELGYNDKHDREQGVDHLLYQAIQYAARGKAVESAALILAAEDLIHNPYDFDSNLMHHADQELKLIGEEEVIVKGYLDMIQIFADMGHSGASGSIFIHVLTRLLNFENLKPLTDDPKEWHFHGADVWDGHNGVWQNRRNGSAFSRDGGKTYYLLEERGKNGKITKWHRSEHVSGVRPNPVKKRRKGDK